jgi:methyltransferase (TIGR00027 family)
METGSIPIESSDGTMDSLGLTSRWVAAARARESKRADRLFDDPLADALAGPEGWAFLEAIERAAPGPTPENPYLPIRTRFFDDLLAAAAREGTRQIVILAAGMDARAFRLPWPAGTRIFEVERPDVLAYKEDVLARVGAAPRAERIAVAVDLRDDWPSKLAAFGHDPSRASAFLVEGLFPYLPDEGAVSTVLKTAAGLSAPGSSIAADVGNGAMLRSPWTQPLIRALEEHGAPWRFGTDEPEQLFERAGWWEAHAVQPGEVSAGAGRWPYMNAPRTVLEIPRSFFVSARR